MSYLPPALVSLLASLLIGFRYTKSSKSYSRHDGPCLTMFFVVSFFFFDALFRFLNLTYVLNECPTGCTMLIAWIVLFV